MRRKKITFNLGEVIARAEYNSIVGLTPKEKGKYFNIKDSVVERRRSFYRLKNIQDFSLLCKAADYLEKTIHPNFKMPLYGKSLPKSYSDLGDFYDYNVSENLISELNWSILGVRKYSYEINLFLLYKELYEKFFLIGDFENAEKYLDKIENEICFSLWTLENRFLLKEYQVSSTENKQFLSDFNELNISNGVTKSLAHYLSVRAEKALSVQRFNNDLEIALQRVTGREKREHREFYRFQLSFLNNLKFTKVSHIIGYDFPHSIIDRYLTLRKVFSLLLIEANNLESKIEEESFKDYIINRIDYLLCKINDPFLESLQVLATNNCQVKPDKFKDYELISLLDKYTSGSYNEVIDDMKEVLLTKPIQFDLYEIYVKSLIYQNRGFEIVGEQKSVQNQILLEMYKILSVSYDPKDSGLNLLRIANNLSSSTLSYGIVDFVQNHREGKTERMLLSRLSYSLSNPIIYQIFPEKEMQIEFLKSLDSKFENSITIQFLLGQLTDIGNISKYETLIPEVKFKTVLASSLQEKGQYDDAIEIWKYLVANYSDTKPVIESAIRNLYKCYEKTGALNDCILLYVNSYFENKYFVEKIEVSDLHKIIKENRFKNVEAVLELPIFYFLSNADENETHTTFERFNLANKVLKPSELFRLFDLFDNKKITFYLKFCCGPEVLKHSIHIRGSRERLEERLSICQFLREKDSNAKEFYEDEIKQISNILVIQKGLLELDESKIYVNEGGIISNELKDFEAVFQRFKTIANITDKKKVLLLTSSGKLTTLDYSEEKTTAEKIEYSSNPVFDIYKELFIVIKDKFLHSKFGIVAYLSTRIRHGVLLGEIRPVFEKHKLITLKEGDSVHYRDNFYWREIYSYESDFVLIKLQNCLHNFSAKVDGLIFDLIKKYLQVYDEENNPEGWFNYDFEDVDLFWFSIASIKHSDFSQFASMVFEVLWDKTDDNLKIIREKIQIDISNEFNGLFDQLENDVSKILGNYRSQTLINSLKACSTEIQMVIQKISSWFKRSGTSASDFYIESLVDIVMEYTNKAYQDKKIILDRRIDFNCKIKGEYLTHFADLLRIFTENIIKHSDDKIQTINALIHSTELGKDNMIIRIENEITDENSLNALKDAWKGSEIDIFKLLSENKSGYHKAFKILKSDLKNDQNTLETEICKESNTFSVVMNISIKDMLA